MKISRWAAAAAGLAAGALALAGPAAAGHNDVSVNIQADGCQVNVTSSWASDEHLVDNTKVVVRHAGATGAAVVGSPFGVELAPGTTSVEWRVWGGGERDYDSPALTDLPALLDHLDGGGDVLDADAPGVAWHELAVAGCQPAPTPTATASPQPTAEPTTDPGCELVDQLDVAEERRDGYDRGLFGDYDRDALLAASLDSHGGYYSLWDHRHYDDASEVDVDHLVALAEAWDSGAHSWDAATLDRFGGDVSNLSLLTDNVNASKGDGDVTEWLPLHEPFIDEYIQQWIAVKAEYRLSVDPAERDRLTALAVEHGLCDEAEPAPGVAGGGEQLPTTGVPAAGPLRSGASTKGMDQLRCIWVKDADGNWIKTWDCGGTQCG